jgi:uncharacterized protein (DUF1499 family)
MIDRAAFIFSLGLALLAVSGCGGRMPDDLGVRGGAFQPCPETPNCVSSFATDAKHRIAAFEIMGSPELAWQALEAELESRPRVELEKRRGGYLHAVFTSRLMRYRDDAEFHLNAEGDEIGIRSASRVGYSDMGVNRNRIESIRAALARRGVVRAAPDA